MSSVIEIKNLSFSYNKLLVLDDISFVVKKSDFIILTGPNGGGKSTLGNLIYGNLKAKTGTITKNGIISFAPQKIIPKQSIPLSVSNFLTYHSNKYPIFQELYDAFEIETIKNQQLIDLSGGWMQKVNLCNAIRLDYDVILLDEPDQNLDFKSQEIFYSILQKIYKKSTFIIISHDIHSFNEDFENANFFCINQKIHCGTQFSDVHKMHCHTHCN